MCLGCVWLYVSVCVSVHMFMRACMRALCCVGVCVLLGVSATLTVCLLARSLVCLCVYVHLCVRVHTIM